jgi:hypothetical protein
VSLRQARLQIDALDGSQDAVYLDTANPNADNFPATFRASTETPRSRSDDMQTKILFYMDRDEDGYPPFEVESLWATCRDDGYELDNIPFYAKGVALCDIVSAEAADDGALVFDRVVKRGGHSTYRIWLLQDRSSEAVQRAADFLVGHGLSVEGDIPGLLAIDVPPTVSLEGAEAVLFEGVDSGLWRLQDGYRAGDP